MVFFGLELLFNLEMDKFWRKVHGYWEQWIVLQKLCPDHAAPQWKPEKGKFSLLPTSSQHVCVCPCVWRCFWPQSKNRKGATGTHVLPMSITWPLRNPCLCPCACLCECVRACVIERLRWGFLCNRAEHWSVSGERTCPQLWSHSLLQPQWWGEGWEGGGWGLV